MLHGLQAVGHVIANGLQTRLRNKRQPSGILCRRITIQAVVSPYTITLLTRCRCFDTCNAHRLCAGEESFSLVAVERPKWPART